MAKRIKVGMKECEYCGKIFDPQDEELDFMEETYLLLYGNLRKCLCAECAVEAIENNETGIYFEQCEKCGKTFDLAEEEEIFSSHFSWEDGCTLRDYWKKETLCAECALNLIDEEASEPDTYEDDEYDGKKIDVTEAALIWASNGKDEDYMFGYTEEELEDAL